MPAASGRDAEDDTPPRRRNRPEETARPMTTRQTQIEVHQAQAFLAVAQELHFGRAAERLNIAQPPLSRAIKQLEQQLGAVLFQRTTRSVSLTAAGRALIRPAEALLQASEDAHQAVQAVKSGVSGRVSVGFAGASMYESVGSLIRETRRLRPGLHLDFHSSQFSHMALEKVLDGSLDVALGRWDYLPATVSSQVVNHEEVLVVLPRRHRLAGQEKVSFKDLVDERWVTLPSGVGSALQNRLVSLAAAAGYTPRLGQTAPDSWTLVVLVGAETGVGLTVDSVRDHLPSADVVYLPVAEPSPPLEVRMIWRAHDDNPALSTVVQAAEAVARRERPQREGAR